MKSQDESCYRESCDNRVFRRGLCEDHYGEPDIEDDVWEEAADRHAQEMIGKVRAE